MHGDVGMLELGEVVVDARDDIEDEAGSGIRVQADDRAKKRHSTLTDDVEFGMVDLEEKDIVGRLLVETGIEENALLNVYAETGEAWSVGEEPFKDMKDSVRLTDEGEVVTDGDTLNTGGGDGGGEEVDGAKAEESRAEDAALTRAFLTEDGGKKLIGAVKKEKRRKGVEEVGDSPD